MQTKRATISPPILLCCIQPASPAVYAHFLFLSVGFDFYSKNGQDSNSWESQGLISKASYNSKKKEKRQRDREGICAHSRLRTDSWNGVALLFLK